MNTEYNNYSFVKDVNRRINDTKLNEKYMVYTGLVEESEVYNEGALYKANNIFITATPDTNRGLGFINDPYFKVSWRADFNNRAVSRISMKEPMRYIMHNNYCASIKPIAKDLNKIFKEKQPNANLKELSKIGTSTNISIWIGLLYMIYTHFQDSINYSFPKYCELFPQPENLDFNNIPEISGLSRWGSDS